MENFTGNKQFDFQIARFTDPFIFNDEVRHDRNEISSKVTDFDTWEKWWREKAISYEKKEEFKIAASYFKAAMFYLKLDAVNRQHIYDAFERNFYRSFADFEYERGRVPYGNGFLPTLRLINPGATKTLLVLGGFDGFAEEIATYFTAMRGSNYNILIFDGPGQGNTPLQGLKFTPEFEKPVAAVLDHFNLQEVDAIGISWGGFLVMRAAAFEKRIKKVIAMDIFYDAMDSLSMGISKSAFATLKTLLAVHLSPIVNFVIGRIAKSDMDLRWKLNNGYQLTGENTPYTLLQNLKRHRAKPILPLVTQDCLLLAGKEDHYVPYQRLADTLSELTNARSVTSKLFTRASGGEQHCQVGRMDLAFSEISHFLLSE